LNGRGSTRPWHEALRFPNHLLLRKDRRGVIHTTYDGRVHPASRSVLCEGASQHTAAFGMLCGTRHPASDAADAAPSGEKADTPDEVGQPTTRPSLFN